MTDALQRPRPETGADTVRILVCASCRAAGGDSDAPRPGVILAAALSSALAEDDHPDIAVETVECLSVCKRPCTVALTGAGRWTYIYGDLDPQAGAGTLLTFARQYRETTDGIVPWRERAEAIRKGVVARIPPLPLARTP
jgi:predicted metal-binding protein